MNTLFLLAYFSSNVKKYDVAVTFMTLMSCDSVCCMRGEFWNSH